MKARTAAACLTHAGRALVEAALHEGPVWRMGFDHHVQAWKRHTRRNVWRAYHTMPDFAAVYDAVRAERFGAAA